MSEMSETILKVPIYINGGKDNPSTKLDERELYLNLTTAHLFAGGIGSGDYTPIRAGSADRLSNDNIYISAIERTTPIFQLGTMYYEFPDNKLTGITLGAYSVDGANLTNINKLVLSPGCYDDRLPTSGEQGQLFFKISK